MVSILSSHLHGPLPQKILSLYFVWSKQTVWVVREKIAHPTEIRKIENKNNRYLCQGLQNDVIYMNKNVISKAYLVSQQKKKKEIQTAKVAATLNCDLGETDICLENSVSRRYLGYSWSGNY